jgi:protein-tyrosine kinase
VKIFIRRKQMRLFNRTSEIRPPAAGPARTAKAAPDVQFLLTQVGSERVRNSGGAVLAFTSVNHGEGVSHVVRVLASQLATQTGQPTMMVEAGHMAQLRAAELTNIPSACARTNVTNLWMLRKATPANGNGSKPTNHADPILLEAPNHQDPVAALRATFAHILIDCPPLSTSYEAALLAPKVDGVVLVVEADRTRRDQILRARHTIETTNGRLMALVLNKRRHLVPEWLYRML